MPLFDRLVLILLALFLVLFGLFSVTNISIELGKPIMGWSALIAGVVLGVRACR